MNFKGKDYTYELEFGGCVDLGFWSLPFSICYVQMSTIVCLKGGWSIVIRCLCFQFSIEMWKWGKEIVDVGNSIEDLIDE